MRWSNFLIVKITKGLSQNIDWSKITWKIWLVHKTNTPKFSVSNKISNSDKVKIIPWLVDLAIIPKPA